MLIVVLFLLAILIVKSFFFDEAVNLPQEKEYFKSFAELSIKEKYTGPLYKYNIIRFRIVDVYTADSSVKTKIKYVDKQTGQIAEKVLNARYVATARKYFLGFFPIGQFEITSKILK